MDSVDHLSLREKSHALPEHPSIAPELGKPVVLVYRDRLLAPSETFILAQAEGLKRFTPFYVGSSRLSSSLDLPSERSAVFNGGGVRGSLQEAWFKLSALGAAPLASKLSVLNPQLLHAHFGPDGTRSLSLARALKVPLVVTFHGFDATTRERPLRLSYYWQQYRYRKQRMKREGALFLAVSRFVRSKLLEHGFPAEKVVVHHVGVDTSLFRPNRNIERENVVLFVGRLVANKGCDFLIRAVAEVQRSHPAAPELVVIGDGPQRPTLESLAHSIGCRCRFLGALPQPQVREWMNRARVFSVPSVTIETGASEGFGLALAEAQAMGTPVASFMTGGIPEAVAHGVTGLLAPERDWRMLASHVASLTTDRAMWRAFSTSARGRVKDMFDLHRQCCALEALYDELISGDGRRFQ